MTLAQLASSPQLCEYYGIPGMMAHDMRGTDHIFFLNNDRNGMENRSLLNEHPEYKYSYAVYIRFLDGSQDIDFKSVGVDLVNPPSISGELIFKKQTKFSL
jgi:hypothetical protein